MSLKMDFLHVSQTGWLWGGLTEPVLLLLKNLVKLHKLNKQLEFAFLFFVLILNVLMPSIKNTR
ncbi:hypothetical protein MADA3029_830185 [Vibrio nigripulchritudo MADA3029]|nr:hypothetical protein VIBNIMADA3020_1100176 [Vibrio nigripulchritudo MADA3020]CCN52875.1 hypothetical protein VIBNIMADA3021_170011 [Vibrio nigripulchritudo MADA3021]CCN61690.1 hypothetical protein MADA3029_830185 [Vibrio nigripulchritudo MADA3029]